MTILADDARQTMVGVPGPVGLVLPSMGEYLGYVRDPANGYVSVPFPGDDGIEISGRRSCR